MPVNSQPYGYIVPAVAQYNPASPVAPSSTAAYKMQGLGMVITPVTPSPKILANISTTLIVTATTVSIGINLQLWYGPVMSGIAVPVNGGAIPATAFQLGTTMTWENGVTLTTAASLMMPVDITGIAMSLVPNQQYWFDIAAESITTASACQLTQINGILQEIG